MPEEKKETENGSCGRKCKCCGCKFLAGVLIGLLVAGTALGIFLAGRCGSHSMCMTGMHKMCLFHDHEMEAQPSK